MTTDQRKLLIQRAEVEDVTIDIAKAKGIGCQNKGR